MHRTPRTLLALSVTSLAACFEGSQATVIPPDDARVTVDARPADAGDVTATDVNATDATPRDITTSDVTASDGAASDVTAGDGATLDGATLDGATSDGSAGDVTAGDGGAAGDASAPLDAPRTCAMRETCGNGLDDNCDGTADEGCVCVPGQTQRCYDGPNGVAGRGACVQGMQRCEGTSEFGRWGRCEGAVAPTVERCDGADNDCDGVVDEGFCRIGDVCVRDGQVDETNPCRVCRAPDGVAAPRAWSPRPPGTVCRASAGPCDLEETCEGTACPLDGFAAATVVCRRAAGACDRAETCTGSAAACPDDQRFAAGGVCRASAGPCDIEETCDGAGVDCPPDALAPSSRVCRASSSVASCDPAERCTGADPACPADVVTRTAGTETCNNVDDDCDGMVDESLSRMCYPGPAGTEGRGLCRGGTETCSAGSWSTCAGAVVPVAEVCNNGRDEDCDGMVDDGCAPCIAGMATSTPWQMHRAMGPVCFGRTFSQHGDPGEYAFAVIPSPTDAAWRPVTSPTIDFAESSALCGRSCSCSNGGEFTYFQTFFDVSPGYAVTTLGVTMAGVDDGARVTVFNSMYPNGVVDAGSYILLGGTGVSTNLARYIVPGRNRVVITHVDDCCSDRSITGVRIVLNGASLMTCR